VKLNRVLIVVVANDRETGFLRGRQIPLVFFDRLKTARQLSNLGRQLSNASRELLGDGCFV
jgi:hypothetical protein